MLTASEDGILEKGVAPVSSSVSISHLYVTFLLQNSLYQILNQNFNILYLEHLIYGLYVYLCILPSSIIL
jgi:hypothetical protein